MYHRGRNSAAGSQLIGKALDGPNINMRINSQIIVVAILAWMLTHSTDVTAEPSGVDPRILELFGPDGAQAVQQPDKVELFRIPRKPVVPGEQKSIQFSAGWPIQDRKMTSNSAAAAASKIVLDPGTYRFPVPGTVYLGNFCGGFDPAFVIRFSHRTVRAVDVLICYQCPEIGVLQPKGRKWNADSDLALSLRPDGVTVLPMTDEGTADLLALTATGYELDEHLRTTLAGLVLKLHGRLPVPAPAVQHGVAPDGRSPAAPARR